MSHKTYTSYLGVITIALVGLALAACGGSGSTTTAGANGAAGMGSVGIVLTDGPTTGFAEVNVTITEIALIPDDDHDNYGDNGHVVIFQGEETVNLLSLTDFSKLFAISNQVPAGMYEKIRLQLKQPNGIELVRKDDQGNVTETIYPNMTGNGKLDLNPRGDFYVVANQTLYIQVDIDADKSLHIIETGNGRYQFRPVVFVDIIDHQFSGKLVRHFGYVHDLDTINNRFRLCEQPIPIADPQPTESATDVPGNDSNPDTVPVAASMNNMDSCIKVIAANASVFDQDGNPTDVSGIQNNDTLTAIGFVRSYEDDDDDLDHDANDDINDDSDDDFDDDDVNDDNHANDDNDDNVRSARHSHDYHDDHHEIRLYAEVVELGDKEAFAVVDGTVASEPQTEADAFGLTLEDVTEISVQLQTGTKVFSRSGQRLDYQSIAIDLTASVDGVYSAVDSSVLNSSLVIVDTAMVDSMEKVHGDVLSVDTVNKIITISTEDGEKMIRVTDDSSIFLLLDDDGNSLSDIIDITAIPTNVDLDAYGHASNDGYFDADTVIVESPETIQ